eukprot:1235624-Amphidinium_carterae.2
MLMIAYDFATVNPQEAPNQSARLGRLQAPSAQPAEACSNHTRRCCVTQLMMALPETSVIKEASCVSLPAMFLHCDA